MLIFITLRLVYVIVIYVYSAIQHKKYDTDGKETKSQSVTPV